MMKSVIFSETRGDMYANYDELSRLSLALLIMRLLVAGVILIHGIHRLLMGEVHGLSNIITHDLPMFNQAFALLLAFVLTILEVVAGLGIAFRRGVVLSCGLLAILYTMAVFVHHSLHGWSSAGAAEDGCEFPILLIGVLVATGLANFPAFWAWWRDPGKRLIDLR